MVFYMTKQDWRVQNTMFQDKKKFLTFSYDDGVTQDKRLVKIFNKYGLKATFNINSELLGTPGYLRRENMWISHNKIEPGEVADLYKNHEVAVHTLTHPKLPDLNDEEVVRQIEEDRKRLEALTRKTVVGMAYPGGGINYDERVVNLLRNHTKVQYARTTKSSYSFKLQNDLLQYNPTVYHLEFDKMVELGEKFIELHTDIPQIYYIWGHSYEFDYYDSWAEFEKFCKMMSGHDDIFYGTNREIFHI